MNQNANQDSRGASAGQEVTALFLKGTDSILGYSLI